MIKHTERWARSPNLSFQFLSLGAACWLLLLCRSEGAMAGLYYTSSGQTQQQVLSRIQRTLSSGKEGYPGHVSCTKDPLRSWSFIQALHFLWGVFCVPLSTHSICRQDVTNMTTVTLMITLLDWEWGITRPFWRWTGGKKSHHPKQGVRQWGLNRSTTTGAGCEQTHSKSVLSSRPPIWSWLLKSRGIPAMTSVQTRCRKPNCKDISNQDQTLGLFVQISISTKDSPDHGCNWHSSEGSQGSREGE